jgi:hypothetical protein
MASVEMPDTSSTSENVTYIDAINYFCETTLTKRLLREKTASSESTAAEVVKNTVVALPRLTE